MEILMNHGEAPVTKAFLGACVATTLATTVRATSAVQLFLYFPRVWRDPWRLLTNFFFFDSRFSLGWFFNVFFFLRHSASLEETSFRGRRADFVWMWLFGACALLLLDAALFYASAATARWTLPFLGPALTFMVVYVWARRNRFVRMSFFGLFVFAAPYLPFVLVAFSALMGSSVLTDVFGIVVGHVYFYLEDVLPRIGGPRLLRTPPFLKRFLDPPPPPPVAPLQQEEHED